MKASKLLRMCTAPLGKAVFILLLAASISSVQASSLFEDNFDSYPVGAPPEGWTELYTLPGGVPISREEAAAQGVTVQVDDSVYFAGGQSVHFLDTSTSVGSSVGSQIYHDITPTSSVVLEYYIRSDNQNYEAVFVNLSGDGGTDHAVGFGNAAGGGSAGYIAIMGWKGGWIEPEFLPYNEGTWYYVRRELDCTTNTGTFYVRDMDDPSNYATYTIGSNYTNTYIDRIEMVTSNSQGADAYIDELAIKVLTPIRVTSPNGGESWQRGTAHNITWIPTGIPAATVHITLWKSGVKVKTLVDPTADDGSWQWEIPVDQELGSDYKVHVVSDNVASDDFSDQYFSIVDAPGVTIAPLIQTYPNEQAPGGNCYVFEAYEFTLNQTADLNIQLTAQAWSGSQNPSGDDDDLIVDLDGEWLNSWNAPDSIDGWSQSGSKRTINLTKAGVSPGKHTLRLFADEKPVLYSLIVSTQARPVALSTYPNEQAPGGNVYLFKTYEFNLEEPSDLHIRLVGKADNGSQNGTGDDDDMSIQLDGTFYCWNNADSLDGNGQSGSIRTVNIQAPGLSAGGHTLRLWADETPRLCSLIVSTEPIPEVFSTFPNEEAPGGNVYLFKTYEFNLEEPSDLYIQLTGLAHNGSQNGTGDDDDLAIQLDSTFYGWNNENSLDGNGQSGSIRTVNIQAIGLSAGEHTLRLWADETPWLLALKMSQTAIPEQIEVYPNATAPGGNIYLWKRCDFTLNEASDLYIQLTAQAWSGSQNPSGDDDDLIVDLDGEWLNSWNAPDSIDGNTQWGTCRTINLTKTGVSAGKHALRLCADEKPKLYSLIVSAQPMPEAPIAIWHFDEGAGNYTVDSTANGYDGTIYGATWTDQVAPKDGGAFALSFDGVNDWVDIPDNLSPAYITIEAWIYPTGVYDVGAHGSPIITKETGRGTPPWSESFAWRLRITPHEHELQLQCFTDSGIGGGSANSSSSLEMGRWYHVAGTYDGQNTKVYINGQLEGSHTAPISEPLVTTDLPTAIAHLPNWSVQWFQGIIDELKVYDYARTAEQLAE